MEKRIRWTIEKLQAEALKYTTRGEFRNQSARAYKAAIRLKILKQICSHMEEPKNKPWTNEELQEEALKHNTRREFERNNSSAYVISIKRKILDSVCAHMPKFYNKWTTEKLQEEALKYSARSEFENNSHKAYQAARRHDVLDQICGHMKKSSSSSLPEIELLRLVKNIYPTVKKLRDRKVKIENKPYIKGFDIDIYIPELNLGIEFDGKHHHSFEYMRKDKYKNLWSDDDIRNYHEIKDGWFLTKGIKILHIKEEDWNKDKQACINKCLEFLEK